MLLLLLLLLLLLILAAALLSATGILELLSTGATLRTGIAPTLKVGFLAAATGLEVHRFETKLGLMILIIMNI
jgi:hypothetical protein